ncbi:helix-turn-helix XRE-family transcriptional regulators [Candidatus Termititenax persephonae]|uniref:Helix-turn-helix XRE-family transcriptional regulators n=1 Tax=Candidatus Termititenax persephonae TaxID=2218525 RepID=A0A388TEW7_9BACT|nr:helix-turn-helix XRE-family transcriptional regulators [Candidatus Termititenax persephonae]
MNWHKAKKIILKNKEVRRELENNKMEYKIIGDIILARKEKKFTQKRLAELIGTKQSNISRLESGNYNPTLEFLSKIALATGRKLKVSFA